MNYSDRLWTERQLGVAYAMYARHVSPQGCYEWSITGTNPSDLTPLERIADGCMVRQSALRPLGMRGTDVIEAIWLLNTEELREAKKYRAKRVGQWLAHDLGVRKPSFFTDVARRAGGLACHTEGVEWARRMSWSPSRVSRVKKKAELVLEGWHEQALYKIWQVLDSSEIAA